MNKIRIPSSINLEELFHNIETKYIGVKSSNTEINNIKDSILLLLHFLLPTSSYMEENESRNYFKPIYSPIFNNLTGKRFKIVKDILLNNEIIECDNKYHENKSYGYKLKSEYFLNVGTLLYESNGKIIEKYYKGLKDNRGIKFGKLEFLNRKLTRRISINSKVEEFMKEFFTRFDEKISNLNPDEFNISELQEKKRLIEIGWRNDLDMIKDGVFSPTVSDTCHRFSSIFTRLKRELRYFITIDGEDVVEIDLKSSHPYFLNKILNSDFYNKNNDVSLKTIFPELYKELCFTHRNIMLKKDYSNFNYFLNNPYLLSIDKFNNLKTLDISTYNRFINSNKIKTIINYKIKDKISSNYYSFNSLSSNIRYYLYSDIRLLFEKGCHPLSFMCGKIEETIDIKEFRRIPFHEDFYQYLSDYFNLSLSRNEVKKEFQFFINHKGDRNLYPHDMFNRLMRKSFPTINTVVEYFLRFKFKDTGLNNLYGSPFSLLLQRIESYYFLQTGIFSFCDKYESEPIVTVHDSVIVRRSKGKEMVKILKETIDPMIGIPAKFEVKDGTPFDNIDEVIDGYIQGV